MTSERRPKRRCSGASAISAVIAVQFPFAIRLGWPTSASGLISGMTSGTAGSMRNADELSMHTMPALAAGGSAWRETAAPAEASAKSSPWNHPSVSVRTAT